MSIGTPVITGIGLVTALGTDAAQTWESLLAGRFIEEHAKVPLEFPGGLPRVSSLAIRAAREATVGIDLSDAAMVVGTSKGPVESWLAAPSRAPDLGRPVRLGLATVAADLAKDLSLHGPRLTLSAACASGLYALIRGAMLIRSGEARRVLVVAAEASIHPIFLASFSRLGVVPPAGFGCRPFDQNRSGFLMSEAAAAIVLEAANRRPGEIAIERFAIGADASHLTGMDPNTRSLRHVLANVLADDPIDLMHAHGTGTALNDKLELAALDDLVPPSSPPLIVYSHKGALGHSLGAAGLVSVVLNVLAHRTGKVPGNVRTANPLPARRLQLPAAAIRRRVRRSVAVAAGFGGAIAAVTLTDPADQPDQWTAEPAGSPQP
ncbi:MAG TPA: beta-ketoacyl synthase N-terminal-like domain-containing protein [Tepidisphaeraceae bacterium]